MAAQESTAKIRVVLDTADAEAVLERMNESLGGRGPGQARTDAAAPRAGEGGAAGAGRDAGRGGSTAVLGGGIGGKLSQIIKLLAVVAAVAKILEPVIALMKVYLEKVTSTIHEATGLDNLSAQAEQMAAMQVFAEQIGKEIQAKDPEQVREILELMRPLLEARAEGGQQGRRAANDFWR